MVYRNRPMKYRQYPHFDTDLNVNEKTSPSTMTDTEEIPLPNERETEDVLRKHKFKQKPHFLDILNTRIHMDEIILLGLIYLLFDEGIQDDLLLILLVYILLTGRE